MTAAIITRYSFEVQNQQQGGAGSLPGLLNRPLQGQVNQVVLVLGVIMVALAAIPARLGARRPAATVLAAE